MKKERENGERVRVERERGGEMGREGKARERGRVKKERVCEERVKRATAKR
jgi:hypothetical protein